MDESPGRHEAREIRRLVRSFAAEAQDPDRGRQARRGEVVQGVVSEEMAWYLLCGVEPRLNLDQEGNFSTITGKPVLDKSGIDFQGLFGDHPAPEMLRPLQRETVSPTIPQARWRNFLDADPEAPNLLGHLEHLASSAEVPEDFRLPLADRVSEGERTPPGPELESRVRALAWLLTSGNDDALRTVSELCRRRNVFVYGSDVGPWPR